MHEQTNSYEELSSSKPTHHIPFLVACTALSVRRSVPRSLGPSKTDCSELATYGDRPCLLIGSNPHQASLTVSILTVSGELKNESGVLVSGE